MKTSDVKIEKVIESALSKTEMKQIKITTSKGEFLVVDSTTLDKVSGQALVDEYGDYIILSEITEEQASEIVDYQVEEIEFQGGGVYNTIYNYEKGSFELGNSQIESLHSLLKSKGVHLFENPIQIPNFPTQHTIKNMEKLGYGENDFVDIKYDNYQYDLAEAKTFYNPYIFKIK